MDYGAITGLVAGACTTLAFLPQVYKTWKTKSTKDLSFSWIAIFWTGLALWIIYGIMISQFPVILWNVISLILLSVLFFFKLKYK